MSELCTGCGQAPRQLEKTTTFNVKFVRIWLNCIPKLLFRRKSRFNDSGISSWVSTDSFSWMAVLLSKKLVPSKPQFVFIAVSERARISLISLNNSSFCSNGFKSLAFTLRSPRCRGNLVYPSSIGYNELQTACGSQRLWYAEAGCEMVSRDYL